MKKINYIPNSIEYANGGWFNPADSNYGNPVTGRDILSGAGKGAALGAKLGSVVPGLGNVVGGVAGGIMGAQMQASQWFDNTKLGQTKLGKAASFGLMGPMGMLGKGIQNKRRKEFQQQFEEEQREINELKTSNVMNMMNMGELSNSNLPMALGGYMNYENGGALELQNFAKDILSVRDKGLQNPEGHFTEFKGGGTHQENPNGGIPQGVNSQGQMRTVEEGESKFKFKDGEYVFSKQLIFE